VRLNKDIVFSLPNSTALKLEFVTVILRNGKFLYFKVPDASSVREQAKAKARKLCGSTTPSPPPPLFSPPAKTKTGFLRVEEVHGPVKILTSNVVCYWVIP